MNQLKDLLKGKKFKKSKSLSKLKSFDVTSKKKKGKNIGENEVIKDGIFHSNISSSPKTTLPIKPKLSLKHSNKLISRLKLEEEKKSKKKHITCKRYLSYDSIYESIGKRNSAVNERLGIDKSVNPSIQPFIEAFSKMKLEINDLKDEISVLKSNLNNQIESNKLHFNEFTLEIRELTNQFVEERTESLKEISLLKSEFSQLTEILRTTNTEFRQHFYNTDMDKKQLEDIIQYKFKSFMNEVHDNFAKNQYNVDLINHKMKDMISESKEIKDKLTTEFMRVKMYNMVISLAAVGMVLVSSCMFCFLKLFNLGAIIKEKVNKTALIFIGMLLLSILLKLIL